MSGKQSLEPRTVEIVEELYRKFAAIDPDELVEYFTDNAYVQPVMKDPYQGREGIRRMFGLWANFRNVETPLRNIVGNDRVVFTEWLDESDFGGTHYAVPCVGVFEFEGDKIAAWRLYYDSAAEVSSEASGLNPRKASS
jgi:limonene-1,2-epoxide hydrolase